MSLRQRIVDIKRPPTVVSNVGETMKVDSYESRNAPTIPSPTQHAALLQSYLMEEQWLEDAIRERMRVSLHHSVLDAVSLKDVL